MQLRKISAMNSSRIAGNRPVRVSPPVIPLSSQPFAALMHQALRVEALGSERSGDGGNPVMAQAPLSPKLWRTTPWPAFG
jgi:hypothetical protein